MPVLIAPSVALEDLHKGYSHPDGSGRIEVLSGLDLQVEQGGQIAITGPSGSGKSTLLNLVGALDIPDSGRVLVAGLEVGELDENDRADLRNRRVGFVFQLHHLLPQCTVVENVLVPSLVNPALRDQARERAHRLLERVGLGDRLTHFPAQLSGGEQLRCAVVRALVNRPVVVLADEPTGSLDADTADRVTDLLVSVCREEETTLIVVTHAERLASRLQKTYRLEKGVLWDS